MNIRDYKEKYTFLKDIYNNIKKSIKIKGNKRERQLNYTEYRNIISEYFNILINEVAVEREKFKLANRLGTVYIKKCKNKRPFHIRVDIAESEKTGEIVKYKVPILDSYYNKLVWLRPKKFKKCKVLPLYKFKKLIKEVKEY
tara:strand:+ start:739 stop:1164 length:426 start_codon:yes stop_codon:yes gene_type:complete